MLIYTILYLWLVRGSKQRSSADSEGIQKPARLSGASDGSDRSKGKQGSNKGKQDANKGKQDADKDEPDANKDNQDENKDNQDKGKPDADKDDNEGEYSDEYEVVDIENIEFDKYLSFILYICLSSAMFIEWF